MFALADRWTLAAALAASLVASPASAGWEYVGVGDCNGNDTGSSLGALPDQTRCTAGTAGTAVVCWDEAQYRNAKVHKPVCAYKKVQAAQCTGGGNPGRLYRCDSGDAHGASVAPPPTGGSAGAPPPAYAPPPGPTAPPPSAEGYLWRYLRVGDCVGNDTASSHGALPATDRCGPGTVGQTAVCWDGAQYRHPKLSKAACIYKRIAAQSCSGGLANGLVYECAAAVASQPPPPSQPPPTYVPPAAPGYAWAFQKIADCSGGDTGSSRGPYPIMDRCGASTVGMSAVCWDGGAQRNKGFGYPACSYKRFAAASCKGGASPGYLYECRALAPGQPVPELPEVQLPLPPPPPPPGQPAPAAPGFAWRYTRVDDCFGGDIGFSKGEAPNSEMCNEVTVGTSAVCWDDRHHKHHKKSHAACAYKRVPAGACTGGEHEGALYECVSTSAPPPSTPPPAYRPAYGWRYLRNDGCHGADEGSTPGSAPAPDRCDASSVGQVSICWDGATTRHPSGKVACNYKSKSAAACTGSQHPGALYECVASTVSAQPPPSRPPPAAPGYGWRYVRNDGCHGGDEGSTQGAVPSAERCDAARAGQISICWDGVTARHPSGKVACAYKHKPAGACTGSEHPGALYECVSTSGSAPPAPPPSHPATPPPASLRYDWKTVGFGNCNGNDVGQTAGGAPLPAACDANAVGKAAVCWSTSCTYKSVPPSACKGGPNSGTMYECVSSDASGAAGPAPSASLVWNYVGVNDCNGFDTGSSSGSAPDPARCGPGTQGTTAVCWDGVQQKRGNSTPACTYKKVKAGDCRNGNYPGYVYRCGP